MKLGIQPLLLDSLLQIGSPIPTDRSLNECQGESLSAYGVTVLRRITGVREFLLLSTPSEDRGRYMKLFPTPSSISSISEWSTVLVCGGPESTMIPVKKAQEQQPLFPGSDMRIARVLSRTPGALEIVLMLADVGSATPDQLVQFAVDKECLLEAIAELCRCGLVAVRGETVSLTEAGSLTVEKLRRPNPEEEELSA